MLETELKKLTAAIYELNATLEAMGGLPTPTSIGVGNDEPKHSGKSVKDVVEEAVGKKVNDQDEDVNPEPKAEEPKVEEPETESSAFTNDDIKSMALAISRKDRSKQRDIKAKLAEHDAKVATDLKGDGLQAVGEWLQALREELGA
jgi:hypothetical protein